MDDLKLQDMILRTLNESPGHEAILLPPMFVPPIMLSNLFRLGGVLKEKGYTTAPTRRMGGWHLKLLAPGIAYCEAPPPPSKPAQKLR
jgi:hypothetical protein